MFKRPGSVQKSAFGVNFSNKGGTQQQQQQAEQQQPPAKRARTEHQQQLPAEQVRRELLYLVENHATVVVVGETGCGKTTQIPRFLHEAGWTADGFQVGGVVWWRETGWRNLVGSVCMRCCCQSRPLFFQRSTSNAQHHACRSVYSLCNPMLLLTPTRAHKPLRRWCARSRGVWQQSPSLSVLQERWVCSWEGWWAMGCALRTQQTRWVGGRSGSRQ